tara:strand:+ start:150 stop:695 length:546 start_codon:yes stop_codon:yes gene_type:complete
MAYGTNYGDGGSTGWQTEMITLFRYVINDVDEAQEFTDNRLGNLLLSAAHLTLGVVDFPRDYNVDIPSSGITPDPTTGVRDNNFINLVILKASCLLAAGEYRSASNKGIVIRDGPSSVDARGLIMAKKEIMNDACQKYSEAELAFRLGNSNVGEAIIGPHRNSVYGGRTNMYDDRSRGESY